LIATAWISAGEMAAMAVVVNFMVTELVALLRIRVLHLRSEPSLLILFYGTDRSVAELRSCHIGRILFWFPSQ